MDSKFWRFRHEKFQRGRPDLLTEIRKSNHQEVPDKQEVDALKSEVKDLRSRLARATNDIAQLRSIVEGLVKSSQMDRSVYTPVAEPMPKKRKYDPLPPTVQSNLLDTVVPIHVSSALPDVPDSADALVKDVASADDIAYSLFPNGVPPPASRVGRTDTFGSLASSDEDILASLFDDEFTKILPDVPVSVDTPYDTVKSSSEPRPCLVQELRDALSTLPPSMQELFVERLVATIADPENFKRQIEAVTELVESAAEESRVHTVDVSGSVGSQTAHDLSLATAVLGAFLARYKEASERETPAVSWNF